MRKKTVLVIALGVVVMVAAFFLLPVVTYTYSCHAPVESEGCPQVLYWFKTHQFRLSPSCFLFGTGAELSPIYPSNDSYSYTLACCQPQSVFCPPIGWP